MAGRLVGKVAIVTGGGRGIGLEVAAALAAQGARVMIGDLGTQLDGTRCDEGLGTAAAVGIRRSGGECASVLADVSDDESVCGLVEATLERFGSVDVLVNAAGNLRPGGLQEMTPDDLEVTLRIHVGGTCNTMRAVLGHWSRTPGAKRRVINICSESGLHGDGPYAAYAAAKGAMVALTLGATKELAAVGATAHVFIPQAATRMTSSIPVELLGEVNPDKWAPGGEYDPKHVPPALVYLAGDKSDWLAGRIVGGWGYEVHLYTPAVRARSIFGPGPWQQDQLVARIPEAFGE